MSPQANIILYSTTFAATLKIRSDITKIKHILDSKKIPYDDVDLSEQPHRRVDMLKYSDNNHTLPQLHVNNRFIGSADEIQELEDWGELEAILRGVSPGKLAAESAAIFQAEALAYTASLAGTTAGAIAAGPAVVAESPPALRQPSFSPLSSPPQLEVSEVAEAEEEVVEQQQQEEERTADICTPIKNQELLEREEEKPPSRADKEEELKAGALVEEEEQEQEAKGERKEELKQPGDLVAPQDSEDERKRQLEEVINEEEEVLEEEEDLHLLNLQPLAEEESCYFSPILIKSNSQGLEELEDIDRGDNTILDNRDNTSEEPELVIVQANLKDLDLHSPSPSPSISSISPSPSSGLIPPSSHSPLKVEDEEESEVEVEVTLRQEEEDEQQEKQQQTPSPTRIFALEHPLGDAVHAHAVPLDTTEDEDFIIIETNCTLSDLNSPNGEE